MLQLPISLGIVAFHTTMLPEGNVMALPMLALNVGIILDGRRWRELLRGEAA